MLSYTIYFSLALLLILETRLYKTAFWARILTTLSYLLASFCQPIPSVLYYLTNPLFPGFDFTVYDESKSNV